MRVLAVDPGYDRLGIAVLEGVGNKHALLHSTCIETDRKLSLPDRLLSLGLAFETTLKTYTPDAVGIETLFFNKNQTTAIGVAQARGAVLLIAKKNKCAIYEYGPQEVKVAVTGYGKSDKKAVIDMVKRLLPEAPKEALDDEYDAIAIGITCLAHRGKSF